MNKFRFFLLLVCLPQIIVGWGLNWKAYIMLDVPFISAGFVLYNIACAALLFMGWCALKD